MQRPHATAITHRLRLFERRPRSATKASSSAGGNMGACVARRSGMIWRENRWVHLPQISTHPCGRPYLHATASSTMIQDQSKCLFRVCSFSHKKGSTMRLTMAAHHIVDSQYHVTLQGNVLSSVPCT